VIGKVGENKKQNPKRGNFNILVLFFSPKCTKYRLQRSPGSLAGFKGLLLRGREGRGKKGREGKVEVWR